MHENRETSETPAAQPGRRSAGEGLSHKARAYVYEESHYDETGIVSGVFVGSADDLGFDDDAAQTWPFPGLVADFPVNMFGLSAAPRELAHSPHSAFGDALQQCILGHRDHIFQFRLGVQKLQHGRMRKTAIQAYPNLYSRN